MKLKQYGSTEQAICQMVQPIADSLGFTIWDVRFEKEGASWYLRIFIDHPDGIDIEDCEAMTRPVNEILDQTDPISQAYVLEVGSAGLEREFNRTWHFDASIGELVRARAIRPIDGEREWIGVLHAWEKEQITLEIEGTLRTLPLADLAFVKRYEEFEF